MTDTGPRELDGDYAREFFDAYERQADEADLSWRRNEPESVEDKVRRDWGHP